MRNSHPAIAELNALELPYVDRSAFSLPTAPESPSVSEPSAAVTGPIEIAAAPPKSVVVAPETTVAIYADPNPPELWIMGQKGIWYKGFGSWFECSAEEIVLQEGYELSLPQNNTT